MIKNEEIIKIIEGDQKLIKSVDTITDELVMETVGELQKKAHALKDKLKALADKKYEILHSPFSKSETVEMAKNAFREQREQIFKEFLVKHLQDCQARNDQFFTQHSLSYAYFRPDDVWKVVFFIFTEKDIEMAAQFLPEIGLSEGERSSKLEGLDKEIIAVENQIKKELKKL